MAMQRCTTVDEYIQNATHWQAELKKLRKILLTTELTETVKWNAPCYTFEGKNVVGIGAFKSYFGLWFHQGALLSDPDQVLINAQEGKTKALRQWRFGCWKDVKADVVRAYIAEAVKLQQQGQEIVAAPKAPIDLPDELSEALAKNKKALAAFQKLTAGRRREYAEYVLSAKRADTKQRRIVKILPMIAAGVGLNDQYRRT